MRSLRWISSKLPLPLLDGLLIFLISETSVTDVVDLACTLWPDSARSIRLRLPPGTEHDRAAGRLDFLRGRLLVLEQEGLIVFHQDDDDDYRESVALPYLALTPRAEEEARWRKRRARVQRRKHHRATHRLRVRGHLIPRLLARQFPTTGGGA